MNTHQPNQHCLDDFDALKRVCVALIDYLAYIPVPPGLHQQYEELKELRRHFADDVQL